MAKLLFHITTGPENTTKAALGMIVARTAVDEGHEVTVFFAGDGVDYLRPEIRNAATGVGIGSIAEHWTALVDGGATLLGSGMSAKVRGVTAAHAVELVPPPRLVEAIVAADKVVVY